MPKSELAVSVIIPCYNEERNLARGVLDEVHQYLTRQDYGWEVIIINDESTDRSKSLVERFTAGKENCFLFDIPHGGKPAAIWTGIQKSRGKLVLFTDMDQSTPIAELGQLLPWCERGFDMVIGSRGSAREGFSLMRKVGSLVFRAVRGLFLLRDIADTQCGFKLCRREVALRVFPHLEFLKNRGKPSGWKVTAYDVELLFLVEKAGYRIKEVVVSWSNRDQSDTKSQTGELARYSHESIDMAKQVARVKLNHLKGLYDKV
jgi:dolichyl-phosphate beta-glucosyltransferase